MSLFVTTVYFQTIEGKSLRRMINPDFLPRMGEIVGFAGLRYRVFEVIHDPHSRSITVVLLHEDLSRARQEAEA